MNNSQLKRGIQRVNLFHMIMPIIFLVSIIIVMFKSPIINCLFPTDMRFYDNVNTLNNSSTKYVNCHAKKLYYTGYDYLKGNTVKGHYYYSLYNDSCTIYLFSNDFFSDDTVPTVIENVTFKATFITNSSNYETLISYMSNDINWDIDSLKNYTNNIIVSQMNYAIAPSILTGIFIFFAFAFSLGHLIILIFNTVMPQYAYTFVAIGHHNSRKKLILTADSEFPDKIHFEMQGMYVTDNFFIYLDNFNVAIIPLDNMAWAYQYSRFHRFFSFNKMTYTVKIITKTKLYYRFRKKSKESVDSLLTYLEARNPDMLIGYSEENREQSKNIIKSIISIFKDT